MYDITGGVFAVRSDKAVWAYFSWLSEGLSGSQWVSVGLNKSTPPLVVIDDPTSTDCSCGIRSRVHVGLLISKPSIENITKFHANSHTNFHTNFHANFHANSHRSFDPLVRTRCSFSALSPRLKGIAIADRMQVLTSFPCASSFVHLNCKLLNCLVLSCAYNG